MEDVRVLEVGEEAVERATKTYSRQPQYKGAGVVAGDFYESVYSWLKLSLEEIRAEPYKNDSRIRDKWLREFWKKEPHWAGAVNQCVLVDSARPWTITGGRNQVGRYADMLHWANNGKGWRHFFRQSSLSYRVTDMGSLTETGRAGVFGPIRGIYHLDSARCRWTGKRQWPLYYYPGIGNLQKWRETDFFNVCSLPSDDERFYGLGWCATSRAFELIVLLYGILMHDQEKIGSKMMRGLLLLSGIEQQQWNQAMDSRDSVMSDKEQKYFGNVFVLASLGAGDIDAKLVSLSQLPDNFDRQTFLDQIMFGYSLILGYDPREFWPVSSGALGTARESEQQHRKAATKGTLEFPHAWQERFQAELPDTVHFEFDERDTDAELIEAQMAQAWVEVARRIYDSDGENPGLAERDQVLSLLVNHAIVPAEWTQSIEEATAVSDHMYRKQRLERAWEFPEVQRCLEKFPDEEIVEYRWTPSGMRERTLDFSRKSFPTAEKEVDAVPDSVHEVLPEAEAA